MARAAVLGRLTWRIGEVVELLDEAPAVRTIVLDVPEWTGHRPGQHVDVRLTAEDGYQAQRSYSLASPPEDERVALTVERLPDGEVSPYLVDELRVGDGLELRGPVGGYFVWETALGGPLLLVAGGSGIVPLAAMIRHRAAAGSSATTRLLYSARSLDEVIYRDELERLARTDDGFDLVYTLTRSPPEGWEGYRRRVDHELLAEVVFPPGENALAFVCGPTGFVERAASELVALGYSPSQVKTERFGPTGG
ncbi:MAG: ferredoxin reductase [Actinomycetota bacterium]|nr:ferredoxin reductase [Actinomycetota bacterium]